MDTSFRAQNQAYEEWEKSTCKDKETAVWSIRKQEQRQTPMEKKMNMVPAKTEIQKMLDDGMKRP